MASAIGFLREAILDTQSTIRAIDTKLGAFLAALIIPFSLLGRAWAHISSVCTLEPQWIGVVLSILFFALWLLAIGCITLGLAAIDNPGKHIAKTTKTEDVFYAGGLFKLHLIDALLNRKKITAHLSLEDYLAKVPRTNSEIEVHLSLEKLKISYIRDVKLHRLKTGYRLALCWVITGASIFLISKFSIS